MPQYIIDFLVFFAEQKGKRDFIVRSNSQYETDFYILYVKKNGLFQGVSQNNPLKK
jgi:hypothetical protein